MSEEFSEDFVIEEEETSSRSFLIIAGSLIGVFILIAACALAYIVLQRGQTQGEIANIEAANATTEAQNALVTQTVEAIETEAARPTDEPTTVPTVAATATQSPETEETSGDRTARSGANSRPSTEVEVEATGTSVVAAGGEAASGTPSSGDGSSAPEAGSETTPDRRLHRDGSGDFAGNWPEHLGYIGPWSRVDSPSSVCPAPANELAWTHIMTLDSAC